MKGNTGRTELFCLAVVTTLAVAMVLIVAVALGGCAIQPTTERVPEAETPPGAKREPAQVWPGHYVRISPYPEATQVATAVIEMEVDRTNHKVTFRLRDGSQVVAALSTDDRSAWTSGCADMRGATEMEILFIEDKLTLDTVTFETPVIAANCPAHRRCVVLADGVAGEYVGAAACPWWEEGARCVYFGLNE
jgi:hypothetical protein